MNTLLKKDCLVLSPIYFFRIFEESIVVDRLIALGIYFKSKAFGWTFLQIGHLIRLGHLLKKKVKTAKGIRQVKFS